MDTNDVLEKLRSLANPKNADGMARFGIKGKEVLGISVTTLREMAKTIRIDHKLALELWETGIHEARILACLVADIKQVTPDLMDSMVHDFDSWDVCDQACNSIFYKHPSAYEKIFQWAEHEPEYERRASFALMACYAWHRRDTTDDHLVTFFPLIEQYAFDQRNFVKKAVNWALRQIGKRNENLARLALDCCDRLLAQNTKSAAWIAKDAIRELKDKFPQ
jgi:3-methyladenine DNA glycosylase AlkD